MSSEAGLLVLNDIQRGLESYSQMFARIDEFFAFWGSEWGSEGEGSLWQGDIPDWLFAAGGYNDDLPTADAECWGPTLREEVLIDPSSLTPGQDGFELAAARRYAYRIAAGETNVPAIDVVYHEGVDLYLIGDGHHRTIACLATGQMIRANIYEWRVDDSGKWEGF